MNFVAALIERGMPKHVAQAFEANAQDESGMNPGINEIKPLVKGSRGGFGLMQWTGPRRKQLEAFAAQRGVPVSDMGAQVDFLIQELGTTEKRAASRILNADNAADAAVAIMNDFLRPHKSHRPKREARYRQMFGSGGSDVAVGGSGDEQLQEVTDAGLLEKLNGTLQEVTDPALLQKLNGKPVMQPDPRDRADVEAALTEAGVMGDPESLPEKGLIEGAFDEFTSGAAANFGDELEAVERAFPSLFNDDNFREQYQIALSEEREKSAKFAEDNPVIATGANIAGSIATAAGAAKRGASLARSTRTVPGAVGAGTLEGGAYGAIWGSGAAEGDFEQVADQALESGAVGAVLGGVISGGLQKIANGRARGAALKALKPTADLKAVRDKAYEAVSSLGASYRAEAVEGLIATMERQLKSQAFNAELHKGTSAALQYAQSLKGKPVTLTELDQLRQVVSRDAGSSTLPADKAFASSMIDAIDGFIERTVPRGSGGGASVRKVSRAIKSARSAHTQFRKAELVDTILLEAADQAASTGSGGNVNNVIRQRFKALLKNKKQIKFFSEAERGAMRRIVRGSAKDNTLRLIGKLSPGGNGLMTALNLGAVAVNPAMLAVSAGSSTAKALADKGTRKAVDDLRSVVQTGDSAVTDGVEVTAQKRALLRTLASELGIDLNVSAQTGQTAPVQ